MPQYLMKLDTTMTDTSSLMGALSNVFTQLLTGYYGNNTAMYISWNTMITALNSTPINYYNVGWSF